MRKFAGSLGVLKNQIFDPENWPGQGVHEGDTRWQTFGYKGPDITSMFMPVPGHWGP